MLAMKIAICQVKQSELPGEVSDFQKRDFVDIISALNFRKYVDTLHLLKDKDVDLIIFPELFPHGLTIPSEESYVTKYTKRYCQKYNKHVIFGEVTLDRNYKPRNTSVLIYPSGRISRYYKMTLMYEEYKEGFVPGTPVVDGVLGFKIGRLICSDINYYNILKYENLSPDFIVIQAMATKFFLRGDNREKLEKIFEKNPEVKEYYDKTFPKERRTSWEDLLRRDSRILPIIFVNSAGGVYWGGVNELGGGRSGIYVDGRNLFELGDDEKIAIVGVERKDNLISFDLKEVL